MKKSIEPPFCACGCGGSTKKGRNGKYNKFILGHNSKGKSTSNNGKFQPGNICGKGRPCGSRNKVTMASMNLLENEEQTLTRQAIDSAMSGNTQMLKFCLERILPVRKSLPVHLPNMPKVSSVADASKLTGFILDAVATGELAPVDGEIISRNAERHLRALQVGDLEQRLTDLEEKLSDV